MSTYEKHGCEKRIQAGKGAGSPKPDTCGC